MEWGIELYQRGGIWGSREGMIHRTGGRGRSRSSVRELLGGGVDVGGKVGWFCP